MKAVTTTGWGLKARLTLTDRQAPTRLGAEDVLVQVHAASVNPKDWKLNYHAAVLATPLMVNRLPPFFGDDLAGVVIDRGSKVTDFEIGDAVYGMDMRPRTASLAEQARISQKRIAKKPQSLTFAEAASMPLAAQTALQGLRKGGGRPGSRVLIIGASGGVGTFAVQIAKALDMHVTGVCSGRNIDFVRGLGADATIDYTLGDYRQSAGEFDLVFDVTSYETPLTCSALLGKHGHFISTGGQGVSMFGTPVYRLLGKKAGTVVVESWREDLETLNAMVESGQLKPIIDSVYPLADSEAAYQRNRSGRCRGKVVIDLAGD
ncbi:alcohol dehydrogenase [Alcanivorax hongdengensis A-11-3]|uniref:Alcohol dehydrogenase n=1 Tax=Alcanivorax hongdengensis A-11-3 TaxID=1177179 RepID=L0WA54_9GAMM|nr:NAD(P)-dependent alcohol dehydrogenase [Alcanivorax hongdengensis]EKF73648.1 alcohol dehydrogenase [Alcanivorax hongdengensis A-11-3]